MGPLPPSSELIPFVIAFVIAGGAAGFLAGLFGVGGGAILVPVFYQMFGALGVDESIRMHVSVGTSLAVIIPTSLLSFTSHYRRGAVDMSLLRSFIVAIPVGVIAASVIAAYVSGAQLRLIFAVVALIVAIKLFFGRPGWTLGTDIPTGLPRFAAGALTGLVSTLIGIGGGVFNNTFMTLFSRPMLQAIATSSGVGLLISIPGMLGYIWAGSGDPRLPAFSLGFVNYLMAIMVIPLTLTMAPLGVRAAHALPRRQLEIGFGLFLLTVSIRFFISLWE
jgi:uncharacterized protein